LTQEDDVDKPFLTNSSLGKYRAELDSYGAGYKPTRGMSDFYSFQKMEPSNPTSLDDAAEPARQIQEQFLKYLSLGDRKSAIEIALEADKKGIEIPRSYFEDLLERDSLIRSAKTQDEQDLAMDIKPRVDLVSNVDKPSDFPMEKRPELIPMKDYPLSERDRNFVSQNRQNIRPIR